MKKDVLKNVKTIIYIYEYNNTCLRFYPNEMQYNTSMNKYYHEEYIETIFSSNIIIQTTYINITKDKRDEDIQIFRQNYIEEFNITENQDKVEEKSGVLYQMTTSDSQKNNSNKNISTINLGDCENILKKVYNITETLPLIIFKIDYFSPDTLIPIIGYEIYHPIDKYKLNLSYCEEILIKLNIPVNIDETKLFKYDPNSEFYTDNCFSYTTENGTDIILDDRKQEFSDNNLSLCEKNCNYTGYDADNKQSSCDCNIKNKMDLISDIMDNPNKLSDSFSSESDSNSGASNIISIKCTKALFSKEGLKNNISSYILLIFITQFLLSIVFFIKCGYHLLDDDIQNILKEKENIQKKKKNILTIEGNLRNKKKKRKKNLINFPPKKSKFYVVNNFFEHKNKNKKKPPSSRNKLNSLKNNNDNNNNNLLNNLNSNQSNMNRNSGIIGLKNTKKNSKIIKKQSNNKNKTNLYNDYELNSMNYKTAELLDKRNFCDYYLSLLKTKNLIIFSFCPIKDYNSIIIKSCIFSLSFSIHYAINYAFFDNKMMHKIYELGGKYEINYFFPKIIISFGASHFITILIKLIFLSERDISQIRKQPNLSMANLIADKLKRNLVIKYSLFFILGIIFLGFFWMLLSSFGAVYPNTQIFILKNTLISFMLTLLYPFFINLFPSIFRMASLNSKNEYMFKLSKFLQIL